MAIRITSTGETRRTTSGDRRVTAQNDDTPRVPINFVGEMIVSGVGTMFVSGTSPILFQAERASSQLKLGSIRYIPPELQGEKLYQDVTELIDIVREANPSIDISDDLLNSIRNLIPIITDDEAVSAYFNNLVKPKIGTISAIKSLIKLLDFDINIEEWFEYGGEYAKIKPTIELHKRGLAQGNIESFVEIIDYSKNERTQLDTITIVLSNENDIPFYGSSTISGSEIKILPAKFSANLTRTTQAPSYSLATVNYGIVTIYPASA